MCMLMRGGRTMESGQGLQQGKRSPVLDILDFDMGGNVPHYLVDETKLSD